MYLLLLPESLVCCNSYTPNEWRKSSMILHAVCDYGATLCLVYGSHTVEWGIGYAQADKVLLTHWGQDKMAAIFQTTFSNAFSSMKMFEFCWRFHWSLFLRVQLTISQHGSDNGLAPSRDKPLSEPMMVSLLTHLWVTRPRWVNNYHCNVWYSFVFL